MIQPEGWGPNDDAAAAIGAANGTIVARHDWPAVGALADCDVLVLRAEGAADEMVAVALPEMIEAAGTTAIILTLSEGQIDTVGGTALGADVQLLCAPSAIDWAIALAVARGTFGTDPSVREGESARISAINAEIARIADMLVRLSRHEPPSAFGEPEVKFDAGPEAPLAITAPEIRQLIRARRLRDKQFGEGLFEDPAWDMMLDLLAARLEHAEVSVSSLCIAAAVAPTTALRWIARLTAAGMFARAADPFDKRRALMSLSDAAWQGMRSYIANLRAHGLPLA